MAEANLSVSSRRLAAIMFTDIVGYTAIMGKDANKALALVRQSLEFQKPLVEKYNGAWLKEMGDGGMAQFDTALDAVSCAVEIQRAARADFDGQLRIGVHSGDITIENNEIYGDGVNVASRLQSIADPGGIYISDSIEKAIRGQADVQTLALGEQQLKNVDYGVQTYAVQGVGLPKPGEKPKDAKGTWVTPQLIASWIIASLAVGIAVWFYLAGNEPGTTGPGEVRRFSILLPDELPVAVNTSANEFNQFPSVALSPDGRILAYSAWVRDDTQLSLRYLDSHDVIPMPNTVGAHHPFFSPDGNWVAFETDGRLKKVRIPNGSQIDIAETGDIRGAVWTKNDEILYGKSMTLNMVPARGGEPRQIAVKNTDWLSGYGLGIDVTPDQKYVLYNNSQGDIYRVSLTTGDEDMIYPAGGGSPRSLPTGHLAFIRDDVLYGVPFDFDGYQPLGVENPILTGVHNTRNGPHFTFSAEGTAIHVEGSYNSVASFVWANEKAETEALAIPVDKYGSFDLSNDGNLLAVGMLPPQDHIKILDLRSGQLTRVRVKGSEELYSPVWGPDNRSIIFGARFDGFWQFHEKDIYNVEPAEPLSFPDGSAVDGYPYARSMTGNFISMGPMILKVGDSLGVLEAFSELATGHHIGISPDERFIAYGSEESGRQEIYVQPFPATGEKWQVSTDGGTDPAWSNDGRRIYFHSWVKISYVEVTKTSPFTYALPVTFYDGPYLDRISRSLTVDADGSRVLLIEPESNTLVSNEVNVSLNWFEEVKRLAPVEK